MEQERKHEFIVWQNANPELTDRIRIATEKLTKIQRKLLDNLCEEIEKLDPDGWELRDFTEEAGRRLANFNGLLQAFSQLGGNYSD